MRKILIKFFEDFSKTINHKTELYILIDKYFTISTFDGIK